MDIPVEELLAIGYPTIFRYHLRRWTSHCKFPHLFQRYHQQTTLKTNVCPVDVHTFMDLYRVPEMLCARNTSLNFALNADLSRQLKDNPKSKTTLKTILYGDTFFVIEDVPIYLWRQSIDCSFCYAIRLYHPCRTYTRHDKDRPRWVTVPHVVRSHFPKHDLMIYQSPILPLTLPFQ